MSAYRHLQVAPCYQNPHDSAWVARRHAVLCMLLLATLSACSLFGVRPAPDRSAVVAVALAQLGVPYRSGGTTPRGFDCSGLTQYAYRQDGIRLARTVDAQYEQGRAVDEDELAPGDLVFFRTSGWWGVSHVGIYLGDGRFIHAAESGGVRKSKLNEVYWEKHYKGARRIAR